jgi:hypothetical protein
MHVSAKISDWRFRLYGIQSRRCKITRFLWKIWIRRGQNNGKGTLRGGRRTLKQFETPDYSGRRSKYIIQMKEGRKNSQSSNWCYEYRFLQRDGLVVTVVGYTTPPS